jgi:Sec7-like guanine-nucleotide exchange factor
MRFDQAEKESLEYNIQFIRIQNKNVSRIRLKKKLDLLLTSDLTRRMVLNQNAVFRGGLVSEIPCDIPYRFIQKAPFLTFCMVG